MADNLPPGFRPATPEERASVMGDQMVNRAQGFRIATSEEERAFAAVAADPPPTAEASLEEKEPGLLDRVVQRFLGTDVDDPIALERAGTIMAGAFGGAKAGAIAGSRTPPSSPLINPVTGAAAGGLLGAIGGAVYPEYVTEFGEMLGVVPEGTRRQKLLSNEELRRVVEGEALIELLTLGAASGIRASGRLVGRTLTGQTAETARIARDAAEQGVDLAPFQLDQRGIGRGLINVLGRFPFMGGKARKVSEQSEEAIRMITQGAPSRIAHVLSSNKLGSNIWDNAQNMATEIGKKFDEEYDEMFRFAKQQGVSYNMVDANEATKGILKSIDETRTSQVTDEASRILGPDGSQLIVTSESKGKASAAGQSVSKFLQEEGFTNLSNQSLAQADELLKKIDQFINTTDKGIRGEVSRLTLPLKGAIKSDIHRHGIGETANQVGDTLAALDAKYSRTMLDLFETSAAARLGSVQKGGLRTVEAPSKRATRMSPDQLTDLFSNMRSPEVLQELSRIIPEKTFKEFAAGQLSNLMGKSMNVGISGATKLDADTLAKQLGVGAKSADDLRRQETVKEMLKISKSPLSYSDLEKITRAASEISNTPVPDWSTFIARRGELGGIQAILNGIFPSLTLTGGSAAAGAATTSAIGGLTFFLSSRGLIGAVSNPANARAWKEVLSEESSMIQKRAAWIRITGTTIDVLNQAGEISPEIADGLRQSLQPAAETLFPTNEK